MNIDKFTAIALSEIISGDTGLLPYQKGPELVKLFNQYGIKDLYDFENGGLPERMSRNKYIASRLMLLNNTDKLSSLLLTIANPEYHKGNKERTNEVIEKLNTLINDDGYSIEQYNDEIILTGYEKPDEIKSEAHFEEIQDKIISQLGQAKYTIWIAVAWFTDPEIFEFLIRRKKDGINIQIIIIDDETNLSHGFKFEAYFETYRIKPDGKYGNNIMHNKFCVVDLKTVIHGSYNWTRKAQWNKETVTITKSRELAESFSDQFIILKTNK